MADDITEAAERLAKRAQEIEQQTARHAGWFPEATQHAQDLRLILPLLVPQAPEADPLNEATALWRRGMMHAVERMDYVLPARDELPRQAKALKAVLTSCLDELDRLTGFANGNLPRTYTEAFEICQADHQKQREGNG